MKEGEMKIFERSVFFLMFGVIAVALLTFTPKLAEATILKFEYIIEFSEGDEPEGDPDVTPWLTATFDDGGTAGNVTLTLEGTNLTYREDIGGEFVPEWYFNLDPTLDPDDLGIVQTGGNVVNSGISTGTDAFQADGDGLYDILIEFPKSGKEDYRFMDEDTAIFEITLDGLTADDFNFLSTPAGGKGPFPTAASVQGINTSTDPENPNTEGSGWVATPEPATILLTGAGLAGLGLLGRRFRRKK
jgi:hypothetical protein